MPLASPHRYAVLLNPHARRASPRVVSRIRAAAEGGDVFVSSDERRAHHLADHILAGGYDTVFTGGGDGTVNRFINALPEGEPGPRVGILRLGTGNAMARLAASGDPIEDLRAFSATPHTPAMSLALCEAEGTRFAFGGVGMDAWVLNDYLHLKRRLDHPGFARLHSVGGYFAAAAALTVPRMVGRWLARRHARVTITNAGHAAHAIATEAHGGRVARAFAPGEVLYEGPANTVAFGTCPYYGYGLKALPFAGLDPGRFHLRVCDVPVASIIANLGPFWRGTLRHPGFHDFHVDKVHLAFSEPLPYQLAGESVGLRDALTVGMARRPVELVRFH